MFYAPWCKYCKQLLPHWEQVGKLAMKDNPDIEVGKFNCEVPTRNNDICKKLGVDRYPSVYFIGYGNMNQAPKGNIFGRTTDERVVKFNADLYPEAIYDWVTMLSKISTLQRMWVDFKGIFTGKSRAAMESQNLRTKVEALEKKNRLFSGELERYKADELFDSLKDNGDPFPLLSEMQPDEV